MNEMNDAEIKDLLKQSLHPAGPELQRDLWPQMLRCLDERSQAQAVPWFDWVLLGVLVICVLAFPHSIPVLLYHL
jgi:hypothetical protein